MSETPYDFRRERYEALSYRDPRTGLYPADDDDGPTASDLSSEHDDDTEETV